MKDPEYYQFEARCMDTDAFFVASHGQDDRAATVLDRETGTWWNLSGMWMGRPLDHDDLVALLPQATDCGYAVQARVEDSGEYGYGLWLTFSPIARHGNHETHADRWGHAGEPRGLFGICLTPEQARVLGGALIAAATMSDAQTGKLDPEEVAR